MHFPQTSGKNIPTSQDFWTFSFFLLGTLGERDSEAIFACQPEGLLFSLALWEARRVW